MKLIRLFTLSLIISTLAFGCFREKNDVNHLLTQAVTSAKNNDWKNVISHANKVLKVDQNNTNALILRAVAANELNDKALAVDSASTALKISPDSFIVLYSIGHLYSQDKSRASEAMKYLEKANQINPNDRNTILLLANLAVQLKSKSAITYLDKLKKLDGKLASSPEFLNLLGCAYWNNSNQKEATQAFVNAYNAKRTNPVFATNLAVSFEVLYERKEAAMQYYKLALDNAKKDPAYNELKAILEAKVQ